MKTNSAKTASNRTNPDYFRKNNPNGLPWPGFYFGIPAPEQDPNPYDPPYFKTVEWEMHILHKDLTVQRVVMQHYYAQYGTDAGQVFECFKSIAYLNPYAMAYVIHAASIDGGTGQRAQSNKEPEMAIRTGGNGMEEMYL